MELKREEINTNSSAISEIRLYCLDINILVEIDIDSCINKGRIWIECILNEEWICELIYRISVAIMSEKEKFGIGFDGEKNSILDSGMVVLTSFGLQIGQVGAFVDNEIEILRSFQKIGAESRIGRVQ